MEIRIGRRVTEYKTLNVEFPYYYKDVFVFDDDTKKTTYCKIEDTTSVTITERIDFEGDCCYNIDESENESIITYGTTRSSLDDYFHINNKSTKEEFEEVKSRCISFLNQC